MIYYQTDDLLQTTTKFNIFEVSKSKCKNSNFYEAVQALYMH